MTVNALVDDNLSFSSSQDACEWGKILKAFGRFTVVAQDPKQCQETVRRLPGIKNNAPPLFKAVGRRVTPGNPAVNVLQCDAEKRRILLQLVSSQVMQRFHKDYVRTSYKSIYIITQKNQNQIIGCLKSFQ